MSLLDDLKKFSAEISARRKFVHGDKGKLEKTYKSLKDWEPEKGVGKAGRIAGLGSIDLAWFLFCLGKYTLKDLDTVFLDNRIIEKLKDKKSKIKIKDDDSGFNKFFKKLQQSHPKAAARLHLWMLYTLFAGMVVGGMKAKEHSEDIKQTVKTWFADKDSDDEDFEEVEKNFATYKEKLQPITPWLISELIAAEGVNLDENGLHTPYKDGKGIWTIGFGSTRLKDGSRVTANTPPITTDEAYELARWHLEEHETFFDLYCYSVADESLIVKNTGEAFGLSSIIYNSGTKFIEAENDANHKNRFEELRREYKTYGAAIPDSLVAQMFAKYPIRDKAAFGKSWIDSHEPQDMAKAIGLYMADGAGMYWRRWLEAGLFTGDINPKDLLECPIQGMYDFYLYMGGYQEYKAQPKESKASAKQKDRELKKSSLWEKTSDGWVPKKSTYQDFKNWLKDPKTRAKRTGTESRIVRKKVKDFLPEDVLAQCMDGKCEIGIPLPKKNKETKIIEEKTYTIGYDDFYNSAMDKYQNGDYAGALDVLEKLALENPNNALLHNDLALIYNKVGQYDKAIEHAQIIVRKIGDKSQYGAAQYNAGVAYENKGDLHKALQNYRLAFANGNMAAKDAIKRINKKIGNKKSKTTAFHNGILKIKDKQKNTIILDYSNDTYRV